MLTSLITTGLAKFASKNPFPVLALPPEIRNRIYSFVFAEIEDEAIFRINRRSYSVLSKLTAAFTRKTQHLALLATCRQIRNEAFGYVHGTVRAELYGENNLSEVMERLLSHDMGGDIQKNVIRNGPILIYIQHLNLIGLRTIISTTVGPSPWARHCRASNDLIGRTGAKLHHAGMELRISLWNVRYITVYLQSQGSIGRDHQLCAIEFFKDLSYNRESIRRAFPKLVDVRLVDVAYGVRYRIGEDGKYFGYYTGEERLPR